MRKDCKCRKGGYDGRRRMRTCLGHLNVKLGAILRDGAPQELAKVFVGEKVCIDEEGSGAEVQLEGLDRLPEVGAHCVEEREINREGRGEADECLTRDVTLGQVRLRYSPPPTLPHALLYFDDSPSSSLT